MDSAAFLRQGQLAFRAAVGASVSYALAEAMGLRFPLYAFLAAVIVTDLSPVATRALGWRRLVSTVVGAACGAALSYALPVNALTLGLAVLVAMLLCVLVRMKEGAKVGGYICGIVILAYGDEPWKYALFRFVETVLGIGVAWAISLVPRWLRVEEPAVPEP